MGAARMLDRAGLRASGRPEAAGDASTTVTRQSRQYLLLTIIGSSHFDQLRLPVIRAFVDLICSLRELAASQNGCALSRVRASGSGRLGPGVCDAWGMARQRANLSSV
jgi:hypothetical protein